MKKNEEYVVTCIDETNQAAGIVKIDNMVVFVPGLLKGERANIRILKVQKSYAFGKIMQLLETSQDRIEPACKVFNKCGGCQYQHIDYKAQLKRKHDHLENRVLKRLEDVEVRGVLGMEHPFYYRNKAQFPVQIKDGKILMGFYRLHSNDIVCCDHCMIQSKKINELYKFIQEHITLDMAQGLRHILMRHAYKTNECQIVFIGSKRNNFDDLIQKLIQKFPDVQSVVFNLNTRKDNVILGKDYEVLYGREFIYESCLSNKVKLHFKSFYQVNPVQMEVLYEQAIKAADLNKDMRCIELYSGVGTIGMAVSKYVKEVIGVEIVQEAVKNAKENCRINQIENCRYICQDATEFARKCAQKEEQIDVVFVDPPRKGMTPQGIEDISTIQPEKIVYISCNPETLIRDLILFKEQGYSCKFIQPVDMFCQTTGLECVVLIERV